MLFKDFNKTEFICKFYWQSKLLSTWKMEEKNGGSGSISHLPHDDHETCNPHKGYRYLTKIRRKEVNLPSFLWRENWELAAVISTMSHIIYTLEYSIKCFNALFNLLAEKAGPFKMFGKHFQNIFHVFYRFGYGWKFAKRLFSHAVVHPSLHIVVGGLRFFVK